MTECDISSQDIFECLQQEKEDDPEVLPFVDVFLSVSDKKLFTELMQEYEPEEKVPEEMPQINVENSQA